YIYTGTFSVKDNISLIAIFIAANKIELFEISQLVKNVCLNLNWLKNF
ncbi:9965_t:CDS:1, partial [Dentiscutata erythropus]